MLPSSRTPEGEPLRCSTCGAQSSIESSVPPGDAVCPHCGTHAWMLPHSNIVDSIRKRVRSFLNELDVISRSAKSDDELNKFLVLGLVDCLSAQGALLWIAGKKTDQQQSEAPSLAIYAGESDSPEFASQVIAGHQTIVCERKTEANSVLLIGIPLVINAQSFGAIEVIQRLGGSEQTRRGYVRFVTQVASIYAESRVFG